MEGIICNPSGLDIEIKEVYANNLAQEFEYIREIINDYPYVSMDTEFPGVVARPIGNFNSTVDYHFQTLRCNVDLLRIIQLGLTFSDKDGKLPVHPTSKKNLCTWQFNFKFNLTEDMYAQDSIDLLKNSGIDFQKISDEGIDVDDFGEVLMTSGIVLNENVRWISFHSGYDFGYLLKMLTCKPLPAEEEEFFALIRTYFPCVYDIKFLIKNFKDLHGGLSEIADTLKVKRIGPQHQAGSDSLLTGATFFKLRQEKFEGKLADDKYMGFLYGLNHPAAEMALHREEQAKKTAKQ